MNEEIKHYGVVGMKWGIRRARMQQAKDDYKQAKSKAVNSEQMKKAKSEYKKQKSDKSNDVKIANKLYSKNSKEMNARIAKMDTGKMVVKSLLMGSYGAMKYEKARSEGSKAPVAAGKAIVKNNANIALGGVPSIYEYIKNRQARKRGK